MPYHLRVSRKLNVPNRVCQAWTWTIPWTPCKHPAMAKHFLCDLWLECIDTGERLPKFEWSIKLANRLMIHYKIIAKDIHRAAKGRIKKAYGFRWRLVEPTADERSCINEQRQSS